MEEEFEEMQDQQEDQEPEHWQPELKDFEMAAVRCGPPWFSELGEALDDDEVALGIQSELDSLNSFRVFEEVDEQEAQGHELIGTRWLLVKRPG